MNKETILKWLFYKGVAIALIAIMSAIVYCILFIDDTIDQLRSLYLHDDIISYHTKGMAGAAGLPIYIYSICAGIRVLFSKGVMPPTKQTAIGIISMPFFVITTILGFIIAFLIPIGLVFTPYHNCPQEKLGNYYVTDLALCKTIEPRNWKIEKKQ